MKCVMIPGNDHICGMSIYKLTMFKEKEAMVFRRQILISIIVAAICLFSAAASAADNWQWCECTVVKAGIGGGKYEFFLSGNYTNGIGSVNAWYQIHPASEMLRNEILAVALTAASLGKKVEVLLIPGVTESIYALYLKN